MAGHFSDVYNILFLSACQSVSLVRSESAIM